ncbi:unnamed protein product [Amoebophrya sp. A25]|nr:unnamed protein product [Amoebophrya sp. A25]|eukprot:GSA25T00024511001.1
MKARKLRVLLLLRQDLPRSTKHEVASLDENEVRTWD